MKIDNTALTTHQTCPAQYDLRIRQGWTSRRKSGALGFGGAIHAGLAEWYISGNLEKSMEAIAKNWTPGPVDDYRTMEKCLDVMYKYTKQYPTENFTIVGAPDQPMVEIPFTLPLVDADGKPVCLDDGEPIEYGGIFDTLVDTGGPFSHVYILEHKSTSRMGPTYFNQFKPNNQLTGYIWGAGVLSGKKVGGAIINGMCVTSGGKVEFRREITTRSDEDIARWILDVQATCNEIRYHEKKGHWPQRTKACTQYGLCEFHSVHVRSDADTQRRTLEQDYKVEFWSHEARDEVPSGE